MFFLMKYGFEGSCAETFRDNGAARLSGSLTAPAANSAFRSSGGLDGPAFAAMPGRHQLQALCAALVSTATVTCGQTGQPYNAIPDSLQWLDALKPRECENSTLPHSATLCHGKTGVECLYRCDAGNEPVGIHRCGIGNSTTVGQFNGGTCVPSACPAVGLEHSASRCEGVMGDACAFECDPGYNVVGSHTCEPASTPGGLAVMAFVGGSCEADQCVPNRPLHAETSCTGPVGTICAVVCEAGYELHGEHACAVDAAGTLLFSGATCETKTCPTAHVNHSSTVCNGAFGARCFFSCESGYAPQGGHVCAVDMAAVDVDIAGTGDTVKFSGGHCEPLPCAQAFPPHAESACEGAMGDVCELECAPGYTGTAPLACGPSVCEEAGGTVMSRGVLGAPMCCPGSCDACTECAANSTDPCCIRSGFKYPDCVSGGGELPLCELPIGATAMEFTGGECRPLECPSSVPEHSGTTCNGVAGDECAVTCAVGFEWTGHRTCGIKTNVSKAGISRIMAIDMTAKRHHDKNAKKQHEDDRQVKKKNAAEEAAESLQAAGGETQGTYYPPYEVEVPEGEYERMMMEFHGGECVPAACPLDHPAHSLTNCTGVVGDTCVIQCEEGFDAVGVHVCQPPHAAGSNLYYPPYGGAGDGAEAAAAAVGSEYLVQMTTPFKQAAAGGNAFSGGRCLPQVQRCPAIQAAHSTVTCEGVVGDVCDLQCAPGYVEAGIFTCVAAEVAPEADETDGTAMRAKRRALRAPSAAVEAKIAMALNHKALEIHPVMPAAAHKVRFLLFRRCPIPIPIPTPHMLSHPNCRRPRHLGVVRRPRTTARAPRSRPRSPWR